MIDANRKEEFIKDSLGGMSGPDMAQKYGVHERTIYIWKTKLRKTGDLPARPGTGKSKTATEERIEIEDEGNFGKANSVSSRIKTVEDLLKAIHFRDDIWVLIDGGVKKWEVGAKIKEGHLEWTEGRLDGELDYKGLGVEELWSVWVRFQRRELVALRPTIQPVHCNVTYTRKPSKPKTVEQSLLWSDPQMGYKKDLVSGVLFPYHDRECLDLWLQIAEHLQPTRMDILGDWFDAAEISTFAQYPESAQTLQPTIEESFWWLAQFRMVLPKTRIRMYPGNHDARFRKAIAKHLPAAYMLRAADEIELPPALHPARLLALHKLDIEWMGEYPAGEDWVTDGLRLTHGDTYRGKRGNTTAAVVNDSDFSTVMGHGHRDEHASRTIQLPRGRRAVSTFSVGCTCNVEGVMPPAIKDRMDWQQSAALIDYTDSMFSYQSIRVSDFRPKSAIAAGRLFISRDRLKDLKADLPRWNWGE